MDTIFLVACFGAIGGVTRGIVGLLKALSMRERIVCLYFTIMIVISAIVAVIATGIFMFDPKFSFLIGYVGADVVEGVIKSLIKKKIFNLDSCRIQ